MEFVSSRPMKRVIQGLVFSLIASLGSGCDLLQKQPETVQKQPDTVQKQPSAPAGKPLAPSDLSLTAMWRNKVYLVQDSMAGGKEIPALNARVYLFGPDRARTVIRDGELVVKLFDATNRDDPKELEVWQIDPTALHRLALKDILGDCYSLTLPWNRYSPSIARVNIQVTFAEPGKQPIMHQSGTITVDHTAYLTRERERAVERQKEGR